MEKKNDKKFNWKKAAVIGGIFAAGVAVGVAGDKAYIKVMFKKHYQDILKDYRLRVDTGTTIKGVKKVIISITDKTTGKTFGTAWLSSSITSTMSWIFSCICPMTTVWRWLSGMGTSINRYRIRINGSILYSTTLEQKVGTVSRQIPLFFIARTTPIRAWSRQPGASTG